MANDCRVLNLAFRQTKAEEMVRAASTILFNALSKLGYPLVPLSELAQTPQYGFTESACCEEVGPKFVRITDIQDGMINWDTVPYCRCDDPEKYLLSPNDILFARTGATTGKTYLVQQAPYAIFASYLIRLHPNDSIKPEYLYSFFQSNAYWSQIMDEKEGSAQPNVNGKKLLNIKVPMVDSETQILISKFLDSVRSRQDGGRNPFQELPSFLSDQRRIVARIEELAALIEEARELRRMAEEELGTLKNGIVRSIFCEDQFEEETLGELLREPSLNGLSPRPSEMPLGTPILRISAATSRTDALVDEMDFKYLEVNESDLGKYALKPRDLLACRFNGNLNYVGRFALYKGYSHKRHIYPDKLIRFRLNEERILPEFALLAMNSSKCRPTIESFCATTAGNIGVSAGNLKTVKIPVPPLDEQCSIVSYLDGLQSKLDALKRHQAETAAELDALLPAVLERAFRGEL